VKRSEKKALYRSIGTSQENCTELRHKIQLLDGARGPVFPEIEASGVDLTE